MKIVCDACQAKYSISDDKVQGKVFKIRCKKCSNIIVVRGGAGAAEAAPAPQQEKDTRVYDYGYEGGDHAPAGDESVWHVVINQDQVGPMTAVEVQQRFAAGEIDSETYIWREGFADWLPLAQVDTFASLASSGASPAAAPRKASSEAAGSMFGEEAPSSRNDPGDLFAAASGAGRHNDDAGDLFGSKPSSAPASQAGSKMRGERNENSVLFSLNNLAQLASDKPAAAASHSASPSGAAAAASPGGSGGEGSGLIDIRSMASAYLGGPGGGPSKPVSAGIGSIDDLPVFGGGGFSEPAVIVPMAARSNSNKLMYVLIGSVGLLAVAAVIVVVVLLKSDKPSQVAKLDSGPVAAVVPETKPEPKAPEPAAAKPEPTRTPEAAAPDRSGEVKPQPAVPSSAPSSDPPEPKHPVATAQPSQPSQPPRKSGSTASASTPRPAKPPVEKATPVAKADPPAAKAPADSGGCDEVSCVLNNNEGPCCAKFKKGGSKPSAGTSAPKGDQPESLDRAMISDGVNKIRGQVMTCGDKFPVKGQVKVSVKVSPEGHVTNVTVKNTPDAGLGNCVASMMQKATFAKTQTGGSFAYPYTF
jgi:predicted Zn finger-like uncharacterized protein